MARQVRRVLVGFGVVWRGEVWYGEVRQVR